VKFEDKVADTIAHEIRNNLKIPWSLRLRAIELEQAKERGWTKWTIAKLRASFVDALPDYADEIKDLCQ
jgi:hypothetical protein